MNSWGPMRTPGRVPPSAAASLAEAMTTPAAASAPVSMNIEKRCNHYRLIIACIICCPELAEIVQ